MDKKSHSACGEVLTNHLELGSICVLDANALSISLNRSDVRDVNYTPGLRKAGLYLQSNVNANA